MASGEKIVAGSPLHEVFHRHSQEAQRLLAAINTGYHEAREVRAVLGRLWECELDETPASALFRSSRAAGAARAGRSTT